MAEEKAFENGRICNFERLITLTLDRVVLHTVRRASLIATCQTSLKSKKPVNVCTYVYGRTFETTVLRQLSKSPPKNDLHAVLLHSLCIKHQVKKYRCNKLIHH